ncbi:MAG TPA: maleylacetate reductase [Gemmatimonadales bacterium]
MSAGAVLRFDYATRSTRVLLGVGVSDRLAEVLDRAAIGRVVVVATPGRREAVAQLRAHLGDRCLGAFERAALHVPRTLVIDALRVVGAVKPDGLVAIGGGSAIGLAKALARETALPIVALPTTYSGSEMTSVWGITDGDRKRTGRDARVLARVVLYDPVLSVPLPALASATSGVNAIAHAVEALYAPEDDPVASLLAEEAIGRLARTLPRVVARPDDLAMRADAFYGAHLAGRALEMTSMGLHHKLCHVLGGTFGLPHALTHSVLLPHVVAYNAVAAPGAMRRIAVALAVPDAPEGLVALNATLGIDATLGRLGLKESDLDRAADLAADNAYANPAPVTRDGVLGILRRAL